MHLVRDAFSETPGGASRTRVTVLLVGIGQSLRGDDSAGLEAVRKWKQDHFKVREHAGVQVELIESPGIDLAGLLVGADAALLVDAVRSGARPGTLHRLVEGDVSDVVGGSSSMHGWGIPESLRLARVLGAGSRPREIRVLGIEAGHLDVGSPLSASVRASLPAAAEAIDAEIRILLEK